MENLRNLNFNTSEIKGICRKTIKNTMLFLKNEQNIFACLKHNNG